MREYDLLIKEGWMDEVQGEKKGRFRLYSLCCLKKWWFQFVGKYWKTHFKKKVFFYDGIEKHSKHKYSEKHFQ